MERERSRPFAKAVLGAVIFWLLPAPAFPHSPFYEGKSITFMVAVLEVPETCGYDL